MEVMEMTFGGHETYLLIELGDGVLGAVLDRHGGDLAGGFGSWIGESRAGVCARKSLVGSKLILFIEVGGM